MVRAVEKLKLGDLTAVVVLDDLPKVLQGLIEFVNDHPTFALLALTGPSSSTTAPGWSFRPSLEQRR